MEVSYRKTARDTIIVGIANVIGLLVGLLQLPLLTKTMGAHDYGLWSQFLVTVSLIMPFTSLGLGGAMIRFLAAERNRAEIQEGFYSVLFVILGINLVVVIALFGFADIIADSFFDGATSIVRVTGIVVLISAANSICLALIRTFLQTVKFNIVTIAERCIQLGVIAYLALNGYDIFSVIVSVMVVKLAVFVFLLFHIRSMVGIKRPRFSRLKQYLGYSIPLLPRGLAFWLVNLSDRYVIGFFLGSVSVGIYSAAYGLGSLPYSLEAILLFVMMATLSKLYDENRMAEVKNHLSYSLKYLMAIVIPFLFGCTIIGEPVLSLFSTPEIASSGRWVFPVIALAVTLLGVHNIMSYILMLTRRTKVLAVTWVIAAAINIGLNILLVPQFGVIAAAITTLIAYALGMGVVSYYSFKEFSFYIDWKFIGKSILASMVMSLVIWFMPADTGAYTILTVIVGIVVYWMVLLLLRGFSRTEFAFFKSILKRSGTGV